MLFHLHPDKGSRDATEETQRRLKRQEVEQAHEILSDPDRRMRYDNEIQQKTASLTESHSREYHLPQSLFHSLMISLCKMVPYDDIAMLSLSRGCMQAVLPKSRHAFILELVKAQSRPGSVSLSIIPECELSEWACRQARAELIAMLDHSWVATMNRFGVASRMFVPLANVVVHSKVNWLEYDIVELVPGWEEKCTLQSEHGMDVAVLSRPRPANSLGTTLQPRLWTAWSIRTHFR